MKLQHMNHSQSIDSKLTRWAHSHIIGRIEKADAPKISSVFLRRRSICSQINWQNELLKLEDAS